MSEKYFLIYAPILNGKLNLELEELFQIGEIYGYTYLEIDAVQQDKEFINDICAKVEELELEDKTGVVIFKAISLTYDNGQYDEYGGCEFRPYWDYDIEVEGYETY